MCNPIFIFCFIFTLSVFPAQQHRFVYNYKFVPDTLNRGNVINENMILEIDNNRSVFISQKKIISVLS